jgi:hypothetical protein
MEPSNPGFLEGKAIFNKYVNESNPDRHKMDFPLSKSTQQLGAYIHHHNTKEPGETTYTSVIDRDVLYHKKKVYRTDGPHPAEPQSAVSVTDSDYEKNYYREHGYFPRDEKYKTTNYIKAKVEEIKKEKFNAKKINSKNNNEGNNNNNS